MVDQITGNIVEKSDSKIKFLLNKNLILDINILNHDFINSTKELTINIFTYIDFNNFILYGFENNQKRKLFIHLTKINKIGTKTAIKVLNTFTYDELIDILKYYKIDIFIKRTKIPLIKTEEIFRYFHKIYFDNSFTNKDVKLVKTLVKLGYRHNDVYRVISINKKIINSSKFPFDYLIKKIILELSNLVC